MHFRPRLLCEVVYAFHLGGLCGKILRSVVGAVPVCPPASPYRGAFIVKIPVCKWMWGKSSL